VVQERAEGPKAPEAARPERAEAPNPGRCPGLGASALSGRVGQNLRNFSKESITTDKYKLKTFIIKAIKHFFANFAAKK